MTQNILRLIVLAPVLLLITGLMFAVKIQLVAISALTRMGNHVVGRKSQTTTSPTPSANVIMLNRGKMKNGSGLKKFISRKDEGHTENGS